MAVEPVKHLDLWPENLWVSYQFQRVIAMAPAGGADPGECLRTAAKIDPSDTETWVTAFAGLAQETEDLANQPGRSRLSRRDAFLRASNYWRGADFFLSPDDPREHDFFRRSQTTFRQAIPDLPQVIETVEIPYEGTVLDSYLVHPEGDVPQPWPVVIFGGTYDTTGEEHYFAFGRKMAEAGFAVLLFDGPGQAASLRFRNARARYDYEAGVKVAVDWLLTRPEIDPERIILMGWGGGGYYAARGAAFEPRLAGCLLWNALYGSDEEDAAWWREAVAGLNTNEELLAKAQAGGLGDPAEAVGEIKNALWRYKPANPAELADTMINHNLEGVLGNLTMPLFIIHGGDDFLMGTENAERVLAEAGSSDKSIKIYRSGDHGSRHVQVESFARAQADMLDWLSSRFQ
jgi:alpha-beta hydrolase superfamily lysophospholipase